MAPCVLSERGRFQQQLQQQRGSVYFRIDDTPIDDDEEERFASLSSIGSFVAVFAPTKDILRWPISPFGARVWRASETETFDRNVKDSPTEHVIERVCESLKVVPCDVSRTALRSNDVNFDEQDLPRIETTRIVSSPHCHLDPHHPGKGGNKPQLGTFDRAVLREKPCRRRVASQDQLDAHQDEAPRCALDPWQCDNY